MSIVLNKMNKNVGIIRRLTKLLPIDVVLHTLYNVLIAPYLDYCNIAWSMNDTVTFVKLFRMQKKALRMISGKDWRDHSPPLFKGNQCIPSCLLRI